MDADTGGYELSDPHHPFTRPISKSETMDMSRTFTGRVRHALSEKPDGQDRGSIGPQSVRLRQPVGMIEALDAPFLWIKDVR